MRRVLFAALFALLFVGENSHAQNGACFYVGGPALDSLGCSTVVVEQGGIDVVAGISGVVGPQFEASGQVTGNFGAVAGGSASSPCEIFESGAPAAPIHFYANAAPGVYTLNVTFTGCGVESAYGPWIGKVTIVVIPPNPATAPPPPTCSALLIDPVQSGLLQALANSNEAAILIPAASTPTVSVQGVSADGVTRVIVAIPTQNQGDSVQLNLINDANSPSSSSAQDGGLTTIGGSVSSLSNSVSLSADTITSIGPTAFALYVGPSNYARGTQNFPQDNTTVQRGVSLQTICLSGGGSPSNPTNTSVTVVRPPVVLVHGLWAGSVASTWGNFAPTAGSPEAQLWSQLDQNPGEQVFWADYTAPVAVGATTPPFSNLSQVSESALGFQFNAPIVLSQIQQYITTYANDLDVAAVQADVVAHSMGALITRTMAVPNEPWNYFTNATYGQGPVEKLITIGAPHLGSPLAVDLLPTNSGQDPNACVRNKLATNGSVALQSANVAGNSVNGGTNDLAGDGQDTSGLSLALQSLQASQSIQPFPMAYISATTTSSNLAGLSCANPLCKSNQLYAACYMWPGTGDPVAEDLTPNNWNNVFNNLANDGVVPLTSQLNGLTATVSTIQGDIHTQGLLSLDFVGPYEQRIA
ncbi:MAG: hypothetical protein ABSA78_22220 [Candidatus Sulfotelmatobacter sp.]|jgi:pimeloyl-ACP methyl ester carboxylesterase